jgi:hypothetical protein
MIEAECFHEIPSGQCVYCKPVPANAPARLWITEGGSVFHRTLGCDGLRDGQRYALRLGMNIHKPRQISYIVAQSSGRGSCEVCFSAG